MREMWQKCRLGDLIDIKHGFAFKGEHFREEPTGFVLVTPGNFRIGGGFQKKKLKYYDGPIDKNYVLSPGDLLVTMTDLSKTADTLGYSALVPDDENTYLHNQRIGLVKPKSEAVREDFLSYLMRAPGYRAQVLATATGSTVKHTSPKRIYEYSFNLPSKQEQKGIALTLRSLDNKIDLNRQTALTLEELAQRLFKSWFVDFDPVRAKMAGRQPAHTPPEIADIFPDRLVDSPLGPIPQGWSIRRIEDIVTIKGGATPSTKEQAFWDGGTYHWATPKDLSGLQQKVLITTARKITSAGVEKISSGQLPVGTVLMSSRAPVGYLALTDMPVSINQGFIAMICDQGVPNTYVLHWAEANMDMIKSNAGGSTFAEISKKQFRPLEVIVPPAPLLQSFDEMAVDWFQRISQLARENVTLAQLRDRLLPKLISGEVRVPEARELAEESAS